MLYLYLIESKANLGYDSYDSAVVCAETPEAAALIHPNNHGEGIGGDWGSWPSMVDGITVTVIGIDHSNPKLKAGEVVCSSFNAG